MYTAKGFHFENESEKIAFMKTYGFATIITNKNGLPLATQLPFVIRESAHGLVLSSHFALANEQASFIEHEVSLVVFSEPHAYISPSHYDKLESVPTWDYLSVHAYGKAKIVSSPIEKQQAIEEMIGFYDPEYFQQWTKLAQKFKDGMAKGTVVFNLLVSELQGQKKISQNKNPKERERIVQQLKTSASGPARAIAEIIKKI